MKGGKTMAKIKRWVVSADQHCPWHEKEIHRAFLAFLKEFQPDGFVLAGDFIDMYSVSRFISGIQDLEDDKGKIIKLKKEFDVANAVLNDYDRVLPKKCDKHYLDGNHEERLNAWFQTSNNGVLDGLFSVQDNLKLRERGYKTHFGYPDSYLRIGKLTITHGSWATLYVAAKHVNEYRQSVMFGHAHTSQIFYTGGLGVKQVGFAIGCMCDWDSKGMSYAKKVSRWVHGWAIVYQEIETGKFWVELINGFDSKIVYNGKIY